MTHPPDFGQRDAYTNAPPTSGPNICIIYMVFFLLFPKNVLARYARSTEFYKISVLEIRNPGMQQVLSPVIFFSVIVDAYRFWGWMPQISCNT